MEGKYNSVIQISTVILEWNVRSIRTFMRKVALTVVLERTQPTIIVLSDHRCTTPIKIKDDIFRWFESPVTKAKGHLGVAMGI